MKKWLVFILVLFILGSGIFIYQAGNKDVDDYLKLADTFRENGDYEQEMSNLQKALEVSLKKNGTLSPETAKVYRELANREKMRGYAVEYFDKAILIYELVGGKELVEVYYEKLAFLSMSKANIVNAAKAFEAIVKLYEENTYDNTDILCMSYYHMALLQEDGDTILFYLEKGLSYLENTSQEQRWNIMKIIKRTTAAVYFWMENYSEALAYYNDLVESAKVSIADDAWYVLADAYCMLGACLAYENAGESAVDYIQQAMRIYDVKDDGELYYRRAFAYGYLALAYASLMKPDEQSALNNGLTAFSYYESRENPNIFTEMDLYRMGNLKAVLRVMYNRLYLEKEDEEYETWFSQNIKVSPYEYPTNYEIYLDRRECLWTLELQKTSE